MSELVDRRIAHPKEVVREGDLLPLKIVRIERDRHRLGLSLRDARDDGERMGFTFSDAGEVIGVPEDVRKEFEEREGITVAEREPGERLAAAPAEESPAATTGSPATCATTRRSWRCTRPSWPRAGSATSRSMRRTASSPSPWPSCRPTTARSS